MPCGAMLKGLHNVSTLWDGGGLLLGSIVHVHYYILILRINTTYTSDMPCILSHGIK